MKKIFGIALMLILLSAPATAQIRLGVKAGMNIQENPKDLNLEEIGTRIKNKVGWFLGPTANFSLPIVGLGVDASILYSQASTGINDETINRHCIDLPVYLRYDLSLPVGERIVRPYIAAGPQFSVSIGDRDFHADLISAINGVIPDEYSLNNCNLNVNLGIAVGAVLLDHIQLQANCNIPLASTNDGCEECGRIMPSIKEILKSETNTWQISVAYIF